MATLAVAAALVAAWEVYARSMSATWPSAVCARRSSSCRARLLFGASRLSWLARRAWVLLLLGPIVFVGCFVGICDCAYRFFGA